MSSSEIPPSDSTLQGQYAGFVSRFIAIFIDQLIVIAAVVVTGLVVALILDFFNMQDLLTNLITDLAQRSQLLASAFRILTALGSFYFVFYLYYVALHTGAAGMTIGKAIMGVRVVRMDGVPLTLGRCTRRYLTYWLAALPLFLGLLWVIVDDRRQGWHDKLSNTCVIYDWPAHEDENFLSGMKHRLHYVAQTRKRYGIGSDSDSEAGAAQLQGEATSPEGLT